MFMPTKCDASAKVPRMGTQGVEIDTSYGGKAAGVIFRGCAYDCIGKLCAVSVGEMIDSCGP
jgi:hypothetical protein